MNYAKWISDDLIQLPVAEDYLEDGVTLKTPEAWIEYTPSNMPTDGTIFKSYQAKYLLISREPMGDTRRIVQVWRAVYFEPEGRVAKLAGDELLFPQRNETNKDGQLVCNYNNLPNSKKIEDGWMLLEETQYPTDGQTYREKGVLVEDAVFGHKIKVVWEVVPVAPEQPYSISKKLLLDKVLSQGKYEAFMAVLNSNPVIREYWLVSVVLGSSDTLVHSMIPACMQAFGMTEEEIVGMLKECKSDI